MHTLLLWLGPCLDTETTELTLALGLIELTGPEEATSQPRETVFHRPLDVLW